MQIANLALSHLGANRIVDLGEASRELLQLVAEGVFHPGAIIADAVRDPELTQG